MASAGLNIEEQKAVDAFKKNVVEPSMSQLVILDFWAEWCGPCKALTPVLESVARDYADKGVKLVKVNVDEDKFIAAQFQVRSIPTVYAMFQGQPVADLTSARTESQLKAAIDQILGQLPPGAINAEGGGAPDQAEQIDALVKMGEDVLAGGDPARAQGIFQQIVEMAPDNAAAQAGLIRAMLEAGDRDAARAALDALPDGVSGDPALEQVRAALSLSEDAPEEIDLTGLESAVAASPDDHQARYDLATAEFASGKRDEARDNLLQVIEADRDWNDGAARTKLLEIFAAVGLEDEWVAQARRRLSAILFG